MNLEKIYRYIDEKREDHLERIRKMLMQPSVSPQKIGVRDCANLVLKYFEKICDEVEIYETVQNPVVYGKHDSGAEKTLICYFMYDTQPYDSENWKNPPMEAKVVPMELSSGKVKAIVNRGAINTKGPMVAFLNSLEAVKEVEDLPVNLRLIAEGEEELGSPHLPDFIHKYKEELSNSDACFFPMFSQDQTGKVKLFLGVKGIVYFELECSGKKWGRGPTEFDIHGSNKTWVDSPAWRMIHALKTMTEDNGNEVVIQGFYDDVLEPSKEDLELIDKLEKTFDPEPVKEINKIKKFVVDEKNKRELIEKYLYTSTLNIDGIWGGYTEAGSKTVLPHKVTVKMDVRLVPNQNREKVLPMIRKHLDRHGFKDIEVRALDVGYNWSKTSVSEEIVQAVIETCRSFGFEPEVWPHLAGSAPFYLFSEVLGLPFMEGIFGHGGRAHAPDEYIVWEGNEKVFGIPEAEKTYVKFLYEYAKM